MRAWIDNLLWYTECRINRRLPGRPSGQLPVRFQPVGASVDVLGGDLPEVGARLVLGISTHARDEPCARLLEELHDSLAAAGRLEEAFVIVLRDTSEHAYARVEATLAERFPGRHALYESDVWIGKRGRFFVYQHLFDAIRRLGPERVFMLEDDASVRPDFVARSLTLFDAIDDPDKACLYLARFDDDEPEGRWVRFRRRPVAGLPLHRTQWFDLHAFLVSPRFFETLHWRLFQPHDDRWRVKKRRSSGVSEQMTKRLFGRANVYQVDESLAFHGEVPSILNVEARRDRALNNFPEPDA